MQDAYAKNAEEVRMFPASEAPGTTCHKEEPSQPIPSHPRKRLATHVPNEIAQQEQAT